MQGERIQWSECRAQSHKGAGTTSGTAVFEASPIGLVMSCDVGDLTNRNEENKTSLFPHLSLAQNLQLSFGSANVKTEPESRDYQPHYGLSPLSMSKSFPSERPRMTRLFNPNRKYGLYVPNESDRYECYLCGKQFAKKRLYNFKRHMRNTHKDFSFCKVIRGKQAQRLVMDSETAVWTSVGPNSETERMLDAEQVGQNESVIKPSSGIIDSQDELDGDLPTQPEETDTKP